MGASRMSASISGDFHEFHQECAPEHSGMAEITEEEEVAESLRYSVFLEESDEVVPNSRENVIEEEDDEVVPESIGFLADTFIVLTAGCCLPIRHHLSKKLTEMGAEVQKAVDSRTTHIVVDRYADEDVVGIAMSRKPHPPLMVDIKWIQECLDNRKKCEEMDYSMAGLRYLRQTCRRLSSFREPSPEDSHWEDMDAEDVPTDPAQLLEQIRKLSERMDALLNYVPVIRFEYHSPDCPTRQRPASRVANLPTKKNPTNLSPEKFRQLLTSISTGTTIRRRRSFTGFILEHRSPSNDVIELQKDNYDVRETWQGKIPKKPGKSTKKAPQKTINDMRKTMPSDLTVIRDTLSRNADLNRARTPRKVAPKSKPKPVSRTKMEPVRADDSDIQSALASLTISGPPGGNRENSDDSIQILPNISKRVPLVPTKSNVINMLQKRNEEDDDFISDVSAFIMTQRNQSFNGRKTRNTEEEEEEMRNEVVFTGFSRDSAIEKKLKSTARRFKLNVSTDIDDNRTLCVVSRHGKRTLVVLKAICCNVPVVRPQWLEESCEDSQLLISDDYVYQDWLDARNNMMFDNFHLKMWISPDCVPDSKDIVWMVEKCGGKITRHLHKADLVIAPESFQVPEIHVGLASVTPLFIFDSISMCALQDYRDYATDFE